MSVYLLYKAALKSFRSLVFSCGCLNLVLFKIVLRKVTFCRNCPLLRSVCPNFVELSQMFVLLSVSSVKCC